MSYISNFNRLAKIYMKTSSEKTGFANTNLENVQFFWTKQRATRTPMLFEPGIVLIGEGHKIGHIENQVFRYDKDNYLIASVQSAFECESYASEDKPLLGLYIKIDLNRLGELVSRLKSFDKGFKKKKSDLYLGVEPVELDDQMKDATSRLLACLLSEEESEILGQSIIDEIIYRALNGKHGIALASLTEQNTSYAKIAQTVNHIHLNYMEQLVVDDLAKLADMSVTSFHRSFKKVTGESPVQYIKKTRLNKAKYLLIGENLRVSDAAYQVGYESVSQFSREYKRHFKVSPSSAKDGQYSVLYG